MVSYLVGGKCLQGVEYHPDNTANSISQSSSFSLSSASSISSSSAYSSLSNYSHSNQIFSPQQNKQQQQQNHSSNNTSIILRRLGLCSLDLSHRLLQVSHKDTWVELDASRNQLTIIPTHLQLFTGLTQLVLANNTITIIPLGLYQNLVGLQTLILSENQIEMIPEDMPYYLSQLVTLHMDSNQLLTLPESIGSWKQMRELKLGSEFGGNRIQVLPESISEMTNLIDLNVSFNQLQTILPGTFSNLSNFKYLNLSHNQIRDLPEDDSLFGSFCHNSPISTIDLSDNQISAIPQRVAAKLVQLTQQSLELLNLGDNQLLILPAELLDQHNTQVIINGNPITFQHFQQHQQEEEGEEEENSNAYHQLVRVMLQRATPNLGHSSSPTSSCYDGLNMEAGAIRQQEPDITQVILEQARHHNIIINNRDDNMHAAEIPTLPQFDHVHQEEDHIPTTPIFYDYNENVIEEEEDITPQPYLLHSLREITLRSLLSTSPNDILSLLPEHIVSTLQDHKIQKCTLCHQPFIREWISSVQLKHYGGHPSVVRKIRFCGTACWLRYRENVNQKALAAQSQANTTQQRRDALEYIQQHQIEPGSIDWIMAAVSAASSEEEQADILANAILY